MAKPRIYGSNAAYIPNARADMRFNKELYQRGREIAERDPYEIHSRREMKQMEEMKERKCLPHELED